MPLTAAPDLPRTLYATITGRRAERRVFYAVLLAPGDGLTDSAVLDIAHRFIIARGRPADHGGDVLGEIVETFLVPPGCVNWYDVLAPEGAWLVGVRVRDDATWQRVQGARRLALQPVTDRGESGFRAAICETGRGRNPRPACVLAWRAVRDSNPQPAD